MTSAGLALNPSGASPRASATRRRPAGDGPPHWTWRDDVRLSSVGGGAALVAYGPGAWVVIDRLSADVLAFSALVFLQHFLSALAQCAALRGLERIVRTRPVPVSLRLFVAGVASVAVGAAALNDPAVRLGISVDSWLWRQGAPLIFSYLPLACFVVWFREGRSRERAASFRLFRLQQAQLAARRSIVDAQLRAVQARVDPQFFFDTLDAAERLYREDPSRAEAVLDALVEFLRAALPRIDGALSVLARELELASAAVRIAVLTTGREHRISADVEAGLATMPFAPGVLLPLVRAALDAGSAAHAVVAITVRREGPTASATTAEAPPPRTVAVVVQTGARPAPALVSVLSRILGDLYGTEASLAIEPRGEQVFEVVVRVPHGDD